MSTVTGAADSWCCAVDGRAAPGLVRERGEVVKCIESLWRSSSSRSDGESYRCVLVVEQPVADTPCHRYETRIMSTGLRELSGCVLREGGGVGGGDSFSKQTRNPGQHDLGRGDQPQNNRCDRLCTNSRQGGVDSYVFGEEVVLMTKSFETLKKTVWRERSR